MALPLLTGVGAAARADAPSSPTVVRTLGAPSATQGWKVGGDASGAPSVNEISAVTDPTNIDGSLHLATPDGGKAQVALPLTSPANSAGVALADVASLSYDAMIAQTSSQPATAPGLAFSMLGCNTTSGSSGFTTLNYEPAYNTDQHALTPGTWQSWDAINGGNAMWWSSKQLSALDPGVGLQDHRVSWDTIKAACPNGHAYQLPINMGSGVPGADGYADNVELNGTTYDFATPGTASITANEPSSLLTGRSPEAFDGTVTNPAEGPDYPSVRYDFTISGIDDLAASDLTLQYEDQNGQWQDIPLTGTGTITGSFGPSTGFPLPHGTTNTTHFRVGVKAGAPTGTLTIHNELNNVDGTTGAVENTVDSVDQATTIAAPTPADFTVNEPAALTLGDPLTPFDGTVTNPADGPDYSNVRYDFTISGIDELTASDLTLQYEDQNGQWQDIPLAGTGTITGSFGPSTGFPLPHGTTNTTHFRVGVKAGAPTGTLTIHNALDSVDGTSGTVMNTIASHDQATNVEAQFVSVTPSRVVDTRAANNALHDGPLIGDLVYTLDLAKTDVPPNESAYVFNVTAVSPSGLGNLRISEACDDPTTAPSTSIVNYQLKQDVANDLVVSNLDKDGNACNKFKVYSDTASTNVVIDLQGYYTSTNAFAGVAPTRIVDTRTGVGGSTGPVQGGSYRSFQVAGVGGVPLGATAVAINVTANKPSGLGNLRVYPADAPVPTTSNVNYVPGVDKAAFAIVKLSSNGQIRVYSDHSAADVVIDVFGYLPATSTTVAQTPVRVYDSRTTNDPLVAGAPRNVPITTVADSGVPANAKAVIVSLTAIHTAGSKGVGYLQAYAGGGAMPTVSNLNYIGPKSDVANLAYVPLAADGSIELATGGSSMNVAVDVVGYVPAG